MADKSFGVKQINLLGESGTTPTFESPNDLNLNAVNVSISTNLTVGGSATVGGSINATNFIGDGSGLSGVVGSGSGVIVTDDGILIGTAGTIDFGTNFSVSPISAGVVTVTSTGGSGESYWAQTDVGIHTLSNVGVGTTNPISSLTVSGDILVTGITTHQNSISVRPSVTGNEYVSISPFGRMILGSSIGTAAGIDIINNTTSSSAEIFTISTPNVNLYNKKIIVDYGGRLLLGGNLDSSLDNAFTVLDNSGNINLTGYVSAGGTIGASGATVTGTTFTNQLSVSGISTFENGIKIGSSADIEYSQPDLTIRSTYTNGSVILKGPGGVDIETYGGQLVAHFDSNPANIGSVDLYYDGSKKFETINSGVTVTGTTFTDQLVASGVVTATTFVGNFSGSITDAINLTGGYAQASSLIVSGITTISQGRIQANADANLRFGNLATGSGSVRNIAIGDQVLNSLSGGSGRNIGIGELSYYNTTTGQYNIGLGIQAGQNIVTGSYNVIIGGYDGQTGLDIRNSSNNVVIADGGGNIRQYIDSNGNVGIKTTAITEALTVAGVVSATSFYGTLNAEQLTGSLPAIDGSALIGVVGSGSGVVIEDDATPVGTAGTINFADNINITFGAGIATIGVTSVQSASTSYGLSGTPDISVGDIQTNGSITGFTSITGSNNQLVSRITTGGSGVFVGINTEPQNSLEGDGTLVLDGIVFDDPQYSRNGGGAIEIKNLGTDYVNIRTFNNSSFIPTIGYEQSTQHFLYRPYLFRTGGTGTDLIGIRTEGYIGIGTRIPTTTLDVAGDTNISGACTASSFSGSGSGLTNIPSGQLTGALPAIDGSALINLPAQPGDGINVQDNDSTVGSARTVNFGSGLEVQYDASAGIATINSTGASLKSRTVVSGSTTSIANNGIGNTDIAGFKSYALMKVGLSTAGWLRIYTDSASRDADVSRSIGEDPLPGSGVIAEVVTTGISTTQIISPFVSGGNLDEPATTTIYASIKNLSGSTQAIAANLTILQLEA